MTTADEYLSQRGVVIVPDILANVGGVIMSHIEWVDNRIGGWISEEKASRRLKEKMVRSTLAVWEFWHSELEPGKHSMRNAAYSLAVKRVVEAMQLRGLLQR